MKRLLFPAILSLAIGCTDKDSGGHATESLSHSFELDTVGKLYIFENINDELAFIVLSIHES